MPPTKAARKHVDHEMAQALALGLAFKGPRPYPLIIKKAMRVAYAAHFRALMEFFHDMRPSWTRPSSKDFILSDFLPRGTVNPFRNSWTTREERRFTAADKLVGHLSRDRVRRHHAKKEWGCKDDHQLILRKVKVVFQLVPRAHDWFPDTANLVDDCDP